jgi:hypothetical protein
MQRVNMLIDQPVVTRQTSEFDRITLSVIKQRLLNSIIISILLVVVSQSLLSLHLLLRLRVFTFVKHLFHTLPFVLLSSIALISWIVLLARRAKVVILKPEWKSWNSLAYSAFLVVAGKVLMNYKAAYSPSIQSLLSVASTISLLMFAIRNIMGNQDVLVFPFTSIPTETRFRNNAKSRILDCAKIALAAIAASFLWLMIVFTAQKSWQNLFGLFSFQTASVLLNVTFVLSLFSLSALLVNIALTQPTYSSLYTATPFPLLMDSLSSKIPLVKAHAWWEFKRRIHSDEAFRRDIFQDTDGEIIPEVGVVRRGLTKWQRVLAACLKEIETILDAATAVNHNARLNASRGLQTKEKIQVEPKNVMKKMMSILKVPPPSSAPNFEPKPVGMSLRGPIVPKPKIEEKKEEGPLPVTPFLPNVSPTTCPSLMALDCVTDLTMASFTEDVFGMVQKDLAQILEMLTGTLILLENHLSEMSFSRIATSDELFKTFPRDGNAAIAASGTSLRYLYLTF